MSADAAFLPCPICLHSGVFDCAQSLRDRLIHVSTNKIPCPVCQEEICGLDKLTIHLFTHVKLLNNRDYQEIKESKNITNVQNNGAVQQKKSRPSMAKNKTPSTPKAQMKFVRIYPKLPMVQVNPLPGKGTDIPTQELIKSGNHIYMQALKTEGNLSNADTVCNICGLQFVDMNILSMHRCIIHNIDDESKQCVTRHHCHLCPKNFKMRGSLMVHLRVAHYGFTCNNSNVDTKNTDTGNDEKSIDMDSNDKKVDLELRNYNKQWQCDVCRKYFTTKYFLKKHKRLHTGETPYSCAQCNKTFTFQQSYHKHLLYHNDEKPHSCPYCGRAFKELSTLHNHQRIHTGEKPFSCETCGKCFRQRVSYLVHRRIHTGVMPYKCTACDKSFRYKVSQRTHKCQAQPPGTVIRYNGDLLEKLKRKHAEPQLDRQLEQNGNFDAVAERNATLHPEKQLGQNVNYDDLSETNAKPQPEKQLIQNVHFQNVSERNSNSKSEKPLIQNFNFDDISETNAELVRTGAKLSLEDTESDNFTLIAEAFEQKNGELLINSSFQNQSILCDSELNCDHIGIFETNIEELIDSLPIADKNIPSPLEILKNLCLSNDDEVNLEHGRDTEQHYDFKDTNLFL